ncbi:unnamed protein product [Didymodactylos carnosus]|uniref:Uncharacterized protein n=1 Tax=Didymodactylos carnosus TaxID=1234261 RepID=A0A814ZYF3_9BILA|nr:unnamed protein product [Didymodactylos carnosus]CAF1251789.1 unnamed protein product [Didymodactylos carnosus]CAF3681001.1 unnamed protein product [Didymodactylos carnosus]CAF4021605.1 unnamed protein product [Didymodactylos carnosus]
MSESIVKELFSSVIGIGILSTIIYFIYDAYCRSIKPSNYMLAAELLGLKGCKRINRHSKNQQEALLKQFQLAGYFKLTNVWHDLNCIGGIDNLEKAFEELSIVIKKSNADGNDPNKFNSKYMRKNLFKSDTLDLQDSMDLILYMAQHAFTRQVGQERYELVSYDWINTYAENYRREARVLRLIDREYPTLDQYDGSWIAGASRIGLAQRIIDFNYYIVSRNIKINGETLVLAGHRELWANIDGISPTVSEKLLEASQKNLDIDTIDFSSSTDDNSVRINEGKIYMKRLAQFYNIKLNSLEPFIEYKTKDECPSGRFPDRVYANYDKNETSKLTETLLSHDLLKTYLNYSDNKICIIDTLSEELVRPNTASTARDAAERLVTRIIAGDYYEKKRFVILLTSNNPYIERQTLVTQQEVNNVLETHGLHEKGYTIQIEGVGSSCKQNLTIVHSELGALMTERWKIATENNEKFHNKKPKRDIKNLLFQTRNNNSTVAPQPSVKTFKRDLLKDWLDLYLM